MTITRNIFLFFSFTLLVTGCHNEKQKERPNILFCIADDATFKHLGAYGCTWVKTPAFDEIAKQGLLFNNAYTPNAKCAPSRSCIVTGRNSWQLEEAGNHWSFFPTKFVTYAETLAENGYHVGYTAKGLAPVITLTETGERRKVLGKGYNEKRTIPPASGMSKIDYTENFIDFLEDRNDDQPFCFWYGGLEPHRGYEYGSGIKYGGKKLEDIDEVFPFWPDRETVRTDMLDYAFEIEYFDFHLGKMLTVLEENNMLENTIIVVSSDNGMPFPRVKGQAYEYSNHMPLAIMWKDGILRPGRVIDDFVSFIDFAPTFIEIAGIHPDSMSMQKMQGKSLTDILFDTKGKTVYSDREYVLIGKERHDVGRPMDQGYPIRGIRKGDFLFVRNFDTGRWPSGNPETGYLNCDGGPTKTQILNDRREKSKDEYWDYCFGKRPEKELYNVLIDPICINNLIENEDMSDIADELENLLLKELKEQNDPRMFGKGDVFDNYLYSNKRDRDFYTRYMNGENPKAGWVSKTDFEPIEELNKIESY